MEEKIIAMLETDPQEAMVLLVEEYTGLLWNVAGQHLTNPEDIRECVNDTFAEFYFHQDRFDRTKGSLSTFLAAIARNRAVSLYRKNRAREAAPLPEDAAGTTEDMDLSEVRLDVEKAMKQLKPEDVEIVRMKYYEGKSVREIAESLGLPYETVKKRHQRGLSKLRLLLLGVLIAAILALLAACAYVVLRHFGVIPGYSAAQDEEGVLYMLEEPVGPQGTLTACTVEQVVYRNGNIEVEMVCAAPDEETLFAQQDAWGFSTPKLAACWEETEYPGFFGYERSMRDEEGMRLLCMGKISFELPAGARDRIDLVIRIGDLDFPVSLVPAQQEPAEQFPHADGKRGGLIALPKLDDGILSVDIYTAETAGYTMSPKLIWSNKMQGRTGDITVTGPDGNVVVGEPDYSSFSSDYYSSWTFGPALPGNYVLHVPYVHLSLLVEEAPYIPLNLEHCGEEKTACAIPGGKVYVEACQKMDEAGIDALETSLVYQADENLDYWKVDLRCEMEPELELATMPLHCFPQGLSREQLLEDYEMSNDHPNPGAQVWNVDPEEGADPTLYSFIVEVNMEQGYDLTNMYLTTANVYTGKSDDISVRWMHPFDIPFTVEEK